MLSKLHKQLISWSMLVIVALGSTASVIGEFRSHSLLSYSPVGHHHHDDKQYSVAHHHAVEHHAIDESSQMAKELGFVSHHDASNHHHDKGHLKPELMITSSQFLSIVREPRISGDPNYSPFILDRPPIISIFA